MRVFPNGSGAWPTPIPAPAPTPTPAAPSCAHPGNLRNVDLQPVALRTGPDDASPTGKSWVRRFLGAVPIWRKLGVYFRGLATVTVDTPLKTGGSTDAELDDIEALHSGTAIEVVFVDNDIANYGGAETNGRGASAKIVLSDRGTSDTLLAHEIGHVLGLNHPPGGSDAGTVMQPSEGHSAANPTKNTIGNYNRITWPTPAGSACLEPDS